MASTELVMGVVFHALCALKRTAVLACAHGASVRRTAVLACAQCASRTEAPSNGLRKYHRRERHDGATARRHDGTTARRHDSTTHNHVDFLNLIVDMGCYIICLTLPYGSVVSCARLTISPCHIFLSSAALFSL